MYDLAQSKAPEKKLNTQRFIKSKNKYFSQVEVNEEIGKNRDTLDRAISVEEEK